MSWAWFTNVERVLLGIEGRGAMRQGLRQEACHRNRCAPIRFSLAQEHLLEGDCFDLEAPWSGEEQRVFRIRVRPLAETLSVGVGKRPSDFRNTS